MTPLREIIDFNLVTEFNNIREPDVLGLFADAGHNLQMQVTIT